MPPIDRDIHAIGQSHERIVSLRDWPGLEAKHLLWVGLTDAGPGYEMQRTNPPTGHVLASYGGSGEVWLDGEWVAYRSGHAYVAPPFQPMAFRTIAGQRWQFTWAYLIGDCSDWVRKATMLAVDTRSLVGAIEGLYIESTRQARSDRMELWGGLVSSYAQEMATGSDAPDPLWELWAQVDARLSEPWTLPRLAERAEMSPEKLRLMTIRTTGRSPMRQVTHLRMRRAETLLSSTTHKLFSIATQIGYDNSFAFSTAFTRWKGCSPREYRLRLSKTATAVMG
jgi:AraC-like DNA-binding protein